MGWKLRLTWELFIGAVMALGANYASAQITPDNTLPNNSNLKLEGNTRIISGGTQAGSNLFHSFEEFSVPTGSTAIFNNAADIESIISRVTGKSISNIDGVLKANAQANLFLLNPNGVIFGTNARLDIGGSFVASTASSLKFADGFEFSANVPSSAPLLSINVPIGLQYGMNPGRIVVQGDGQGLRSTSDLIDTIAGLRVQPNQTLALVGGDVSLEGATLKAVGGRIELGSVTASSFVSLTPISKGFSFGYDKVQNFGNIQLSQQAAVDSSGEGGGDIQVWGNSVTLTNGSQIEASTLGAKQGGNLIVNTQDSVQLFGTSADSQFRTGLFTNAYQGATGAAGDLTINTRELLVRDGGQVSASTFGAGNGGNLTVKADSVRLIGASSINPQSRSTLLSETKSTGAAGNLTLNTRELLVQNTAFVSARTYGAGDAGNLTVNADSVQLTGNSPRGDASALIVASERGATGAAGDLTINTGKLSLEDGAQVSAGTWGSKKGGNLKVTADSVQVIGIGTSSSSLNTNAFSTATGAAGDLTINTRALLVRDRSIVSVQSLGKGNAGNLNVNARSVSLDNATLTANTQSINTDPNQEQATINLRSVRDLILRRNSKITTNARGENVIGGNINIDTDVLAAFENSDISANSANFRGGRVTINTQGIFGIQFRDVASDKTSDITATGGRPEYSGTVVINTPDVDPNSGLINLPYVPVDTSVAQSCTAGGTVAKSEFIITGRGGLPPNPNETLSTDAVQVDLITLKPEVNKHSTPAVSTNSTKSATPPIVEATGWVRSANGDVVLTVDAPTATPPNSWHQTADCRASN